MIDIYCERTNESLFAEPLNAISNLAFIGAALLVTRFCRRTTGEINLGNKIMIANIYAIGIGSFLLHVFASPATLMLDMTSIFIFQLVWVWLYLERVVKSGWPLKLVVIFCLVIMSYLLAHYPDPTLGSLHYLGALLTIIAMGIYHIRNVREEPTALLSIAGLFFLALVFRGADVLLCEQVPIGTHFIWHGLSATVLYLAAKTVVKT